MEAPSAVGACIEHVDRQGLPCARCGTFRCTDCLSDGLCARCRESGALRPVAPEDVVGFGRRVGGRLIDLGVGYGAGLVGGVFAAIALGILQALNLADPGWAGRFSHGFGFNFLAGTVSDIAGATVSTAIAQASIGKALLGLRVLRTDGGRVGFGGALIRELVYIIDAFFFGLVAKAAMDASPLQQRHGDRLGGTCVVRKDAMPSAAAVSGGRFMAGLLIGLGVHIAVLAAFFVVAGR